MWSLTASATFVWSVLDIYVGILLFLLISSAITKVVFKLNENIQNS